MAIAGTMTADDKKVLRRFVNVESERALKRLERLAKAELDVVGKVTDADEAAATEWVMALRAHLGEAFQATEKLESLGFRVEYKERQQHYGTTLSVVDIGKVTISLKLTGPEDLERSKVVKAKYAARRVEIEDAVREAHFDIVSAGNDAVRERLDALKTKLGEIVGTGPDPVE